MAERSFACCLIHGAERKLAVPTYYSMFDFYGMECKVARVSQSRMLGEKDVALTCMLIEVKHSVIVCARCGGGNAVL